MGSLRLTLCAGAVFAAALTASAPSAHAADPGGVSVVPASPAPGSDIQVRAKGCEGKSGTAASEAFVADAQLTALGGGAAGTLSGETRVRSSLQPGTYDVRITCDGREDKVKGTIKVGGGKSAAGKPPPVTEPSATKPSATKPAASPVAPVRAGGGGAAARLAAANPAGPAESAAPANSMDDDARHAGPGARHAVIGLVLAGVAAVAVVARGARRGRGTK